MARVAWPASLMRLFLAKRVSSVIGIGLHLPCVVGICMRYYIKNCRELGELSSARLKITPLSCSLFVTVLLTTLGKGGKRKTFNPRNRPSLRNSEKFDTTTNKNTIRTFGGTIVARKYLHDIEYYQMEETHKKEDPPAKRMGKTN